MVAPTESIEPTRAVIEEAAAWRTQLADPDFTPADQASFDRWLHSDPAHLIAFDRMGAIEGRAQRQDRVGRTALNRMFSRRSSRTVPLLLLMLGGITTLAWVGAYNPQIRSRLADERTVVGEVKPVALALGDRLTLDSASAADVDEQDRSIRLWRGGIMAQVKPGLARPFIIHTAQGTARALGTQFSVRIVGDATFVEVIQSHVQACAATGNRSCLTLAPGQSARLDKAGVHRDADINPMVAGGWIDGLLFADDRSLVSIIDELNRYRADPVRYSNADIAGLHVTGTFPLTDTDRALESITAILPVDVEREGAGVVVRRR